jgi:hypothetical protein
MTLSAQMRVLAISAGCPTVEKIAVFRDRKWDSPESGISGLKFPFVLYNLLQLMKLLAVLAQLNTFEHHAETKGLLHRPLPRVWQHDQTIRTALHGSRERHTAWVFSRA